MTQSGSALPLSAFDQACRRILLSVQAELDGMNAAEMREVAELLTDSGWYVSRYADQPRLRLVDD